MIRALAVWLCLAAPAVAQEPELLIAGTLPANGDYGVVLQALAEVNADGTTLSLFWDEMTRDGHYVAQPDWPTIANAVYPGQNLRVALVFPVIDTVADRRPPHLRHLPWDDPKVAEEFGAFMTEVLSRMPDIELTSIAIGNEVDGHLSGAGWDRYRTFFARTRAMVRNQLPDVPVGVTLTWGGLQHPPARALADMGDLWMVNWYPLDARFHVRDVTQTRQEIEAMLTAAEPLPLRLTETGSPSEGCAGSLANQEMFVRTVLATAEDEPGLTSVTLVWLHDLPPASVGAYADYYGLTDPCFLDYLSSLGLRTHAGLDKPAFRFLRERAR